MRTFLAPIRAGLLFGGLFGAILWLAPARGLACKCAPPPSATEARDQASAVFEARVTQLTPGSASDEPGPSDDNLRGGSGEVEVTLRVTQAWKGVSTETVRVRTRSDSAACGFPFEVGRSYLVYANQSTTPDTAVPLEVLRCGRSRPADEAEEDFAALGLGVVPVAAQDPANIPPAEQTPAQPKPLAPAAGGCAGCTAAPNARDGAPWALLGLALLVWATARKARG
ncbi:MAG TPA: hypothetical protein VJR89_35930 [Polyangiales bacterium]|nr:hypothetical protein [Polyangiales bacterium]